jgi:hypothetical protein
MWQIHQSTARWESDRLRLSVDLACPALGFHDIAWQATEFPHTRVLQVSVPSRGHHDSERVEDVYARGTDAIVTYAETSHSPVHPQVYWRVLDTPHRSPAIILEAIVSVQTRLLDSDPRIQLASTVASDPWLHRAAEDSAQRFRTISPQSRSPVSIDVAPPGIALLARIRESAYSYGHIVHAADLIDARLTWDQAGQMSTLSTVFFGQRLEKGVLRRVRARAMLIPRAQDETLLAAHLHESVHAAPPLAT